MTQALLLDRQLKVTYAPRSKEMNEFNIHPLALVQRGPISYLFVRINDFQDTRLLAMHRITQAEMLDDETIRPENFDIDAEIEKGRFGFGQGESIQLIARFTAEAGEHLYETPLSIDQHITVETDGLTVTATVANTPQLVWWLLGMGAGVEVLAPSQVRIQIAETHSKAALKYIA